MSDPDDSVEEIMAKPKPTLRSVLSPIQVVESFTSFVKTHEIEYYQVVKLWQQLKTWPEVDKVNFLSQFYSSGAIFNYRADDMVEAICELQWNDVPPAERQKYANFIVSIAQFNPEHLTKIIRCIITNGIPQTRREVEAETGIIKFVRILDCVEQESCTQTAVDSINSLIPVFSPYAQLLNESMTKLTPHKKCSTEELLGFIRLSMVFANVHISIAADLWVGIINCVLKLDTEISDDLDASNVHDVRQLFPRHLRSDIDDVLDSRAHYRQKLDDALLMILCWISLEKMDGLNAADYEHTKWMANSAAPSDLYPILHKALTNEVLWTHELDYAPFIWLYMCHLRPKLADVFLRALWRITITPSYSPNEWKRSHNAVALLAGVLARANFVDQAQLQQWLSQMCAWCASYVDGVGQVKCAGGAQHSIFYAVAQAFMFVFCYRYRELNEPSTLDDIRMWNIGKVLHSQLEPLNYIFKPVAVGFANITRFMQIAYCKHIITLDSRRRIIETHFPFLHCDLVEMSQVLEPLLRHFDPVEDDSDLMSAARSRRTTEALVDNELNDEYNFMQVDDGIDVCYDEASTMLVD